MAGLAAGLFVAVPELEHLVFSAEKHIRTATWNQHLHCMVRTPSAWRSLSGPFDAIQTGLPSPEH